MDMSTVGYGDENVDWLTKHYTTEAIKIPNENDRNLAGVIIREAIGLDKSVTEPRVIIHPNKNGKHYILHFLFSRDTMVDIMEAVTLKRIYPQRIFGMKIQYDFGENALSLTVCVLKTPFLNPIKRTTVLILEEDVQYLPAVHSDMMGEGIGVRRTRGPARKHATASERPTKRRRRYRDTESVDEDSVSSVAAEDHV